MVKLTGKLAVLALALSLQAVPLMACMIPDSLLTEEERACCKAMADDCGQMEMPSSHSCCTVTVHQGDPFLVNSRFASGPLQSAAGVPLIGGSDVFLPLTLMQRPFVALIHSPPVSPPSVFSILRI
jgi:hypothetical protein